MTNNLFSLQLNYNDAELEGYERIKKKKDQNKPLTSDERIEDLLGEANRGFCIEREDYFKAFRDAERAHGIQGEEV